MIAGGSRRRNIELRLGLVAIAITVFGYVLVQLADQSDLPTDLWAFVVAMNTLDGSAYLTEASTRCKRGSQRVALLALPSRWRDAVLRSRCSTA